MNKLFVTITASTAVVLLSTGSASANEVDMKQDLLASLAADIATEVAAVTMTTIDSAKVSLQQGITGWYEETMKADQKATAVASKNASQDKQDQGE